MTKFNKSLLAASVVLACNAHAASINMTDTTAQVITIAAEEDVASNGSDTVVSAAFNGGSDDIIFAIGDNISDASQVDRYIRLELDNGATFDGNPTANTEDASNAGNIVAETSVTLASGGNGASFAIFRLLVDTGNDGATANGAIVSADQIHVNLSTGISPVSQSTVTATVAQYATFADASAETSVLSVGADSEAILQWASDMTLTTTAATSASGLAKIDVASSNTDFASDAVNVNDQTNTLGTLAFAQGTTAIQFDNSDITDDEVYTTTSTITITGDLTATQDLTNGAADGTYNSDATHGLFLETDDDCTDAMTASERFTTAADGQSAVYTVDANDAVNTLSADVCLTVNGVSTIVPSSYTHSISYGVETGFTNQAAASGTLATTTKNGATSSQNLALTPTTEGGTFASFFRVVNTSSVAGDVSVTLTNDSGDTVTFDLGNVSGDNTGAAVSTNLAGGNSTGLISIDALYAAGQAADATFSTGAGKLRVSFDGEFPSIDIDQLALTTDNTGFYLMNN